MTRKQVAVRTALGGTLAFLLSAAFTGMATWESFGYWGNFISQLLAFSAAGLIAGRAAFRWPGWTVGISLGLTWGIAAVAVGINSITNGGPIRSAGLVVVYVGAATVTAWYFGRRRRLRAIVVPDDGSTEAVTPRPL